MDGRTLILHLIRLSNRPLELGANLVEELIQAGDAGLGWGGTAPHAAVAGIHGHEARRDAGF